MCIAYMKSLIQIPVNSCTSCLLALSDTPSVYGILFFMETWKDIPGYETLYQCSSYGRIKSMQRLENSKRRKPISEKILKPATTNDGYFRVCLWNLKQSCQSVHRLVAITFIPNPENKKQVNHKNGIKTDNRVENLEWCTIYENLEHGYRTGLLDNRGEKCGRVKLTEEQVKEIRRKYVRIKYNTIMLAKEYGVTHQNIFDIIKRKSWSHL